MIKNNTLLEVKNLKISFKTDEGIILAVDGVSFSVDRGKTLGIVGESGSGKSVSTKAVMQLLPTNAIIAEDSSIEFGMKNGNILEIAHLNSRGEEIRAVRGGEIGMIFQEPMASFSPVYTVGNQIIETILLHRNVNKKEARKIALEMLDKVGISDPKTRLDQYPFELSGGMRQRAMIATALSTNPSLLIADEPTTALDVTIQAQILALFNDLQEEFHMGVIFISHDLGVIAQVADEVAVMYLGKIVEQGTAQEVIHNPQHPYTQSLLEAIPRLDNLGTKLIAIPGDIPSPLARPTGCPFHTRCSKKIGPICEESMPIHTIINPSHSVHCFLHES